MQHTAVLSQLGDHQKALKKVLDCFKFFKRIFSSFAEIMKTMILIGIDNLKTFQFSSKESFMRCKKIVEFIKTLELPS